MSRAVAMTVDASGKHSRFAYFDVPSHPGTRNVRFVSFVQYIVSCSLWYLAARYLLIFCGVWQTWVAASAACGYNV